LCAQVVHNIHRDENGIKTEKRLNRFYLCYVTVKFVKMICFKRRDGKGK